MMDTYNANNHCPKCGHDDVGSSYCAGRSYPDHSFLDPYHGDEEAIHRTCRRCGYKWAEAPIVKAQRGQEEGT